MLNYVGPGGYFGEIGLLSDLPELRDLAPAGVRTATCTALDHVDLVRITPGRLPRHPRPFAGRARRVIAEARKRLEANLKDQRDVRETPLGPFLDQGLMNAQSLLVLDLEKCTRATNAPRPAPTRTRG